MIRLSQPLIFITGAPRSGTSLLAKILDAHPDIAILMENIFGNRRRHWKRAAFWHSPDLLRNEVERVYSKLKEPVVGNKVVTPDVWDACDILQFCRLFESFKILFVVRNPKDEALSRLRREPEDFFEVFSQEARDHILLDFRGRFDTYFSSWRQSIENYWKLRDGLGGAVNLVYYEDFCRDFENQVRQVLAFLQIPFSDRVFKWHELPHHNAEGELVRDLKYPDRAIFASPEIAEYPDELEAAFPAIRWQFELWKKRML